MDLRRIGRSLVIVGAVALAAALYTWYAFYSSVLPQGSRLPAECLYQSEGVCRMIAAGAQVAGSSPYQPILFWFACCIFAIGVVLALISPRRR